MNVYNNVFMLNTIGLILKNISLDIMLFEILTLKYKIILDMI